MSGKPGHGRPALDLTGQRFGRLVVLRREDGPARRPRWRFRCDCGAEKTADGNEIRRGHVQSCGCLRAETMARANRRHGDVGAGNGTPEWNAWASMWKRCTNPKHKFYRLYGGRGIAVCDRWKAFKNFLADMGRRPTPQHSLDRYPDNDGNYEPGNCRWATKSEQAKNTRPRRRRGDGTFAGGS